MLRLTLPSTGTAPLEQDGYTVELLPKLAFFTLWDRPPSSGLVRSPARDAPAGGLPSGGPPLPELMGGGAGPAVLSPDDAPADKVPADDTRSPGLGCPCFVPGRLCHVRGLLPWRTGLQQGC